MNNKSNKRNDSDDPVEFGGAKLTKLEANRIGVGILFGIVGVIVVVLSPIEAKSSVSYAVLVFFVFFGYFVISPLIFKKWK